MTVHTRRGMLAIMGNSKSSENEVTLVHFSDLHISEGDSQAQGLLSRAVERAQRIEADGVVISGDLTEHGTAGDFDAAINAVSQAAQSFRETIVVPGNHDTGKTADALALKKLAVPAPERFHEVLDRCSPKARSVSTVRFPTRTDLADGQCVVYGLESSADCHDLPLSARGQLGETQLTALDTDLRSLEPVQRRVVVLHHHVNRLPIGQTIKAMFESDITMGLIDRRALAQVLRRNNVDLVLHGHRHYYSRRKRGPTNIVQASSTTKGCSFTGEMFFNRVTLGLETGKIQVHRVPFAPPIKSSTLADAFGSREQMEAWVEVMQRAYDGEETFQEFRRAVVDQAARFRAYNAASEQLDNDIDAMLELAGGPPVSAPDILSPPAAPDQALDREAFLRLMIAVASALADGDRDSLYFDDEEDSDV